MSRMCTRRTNPTGRYERVARLESGERRIDVVEFTVLARVIGFDKDEVLSIVEAATEPDHRI